MLRCLSHRKFQLSIGALFVVMAFIAIWPVGKSRLNPDDVPSLRIYDCRGTLLREVLSSQQGHGIWLPLREVSPHFCSAMVAVEDKRFYHHFGVDPFAILRAAWLNVSKHQVVSGGSTITQQLARQLYALPRRWYAKPLEALLAMRLEVWLSKEEILEQYINRVPFGNQTFGVEAAARLYFDKPAAHLSVSEAAFLAGLPQSPSGYDPYRFPDKAKQRQSMVLQAMLRAGELDSSNYIRIQQTPTEVAPRKNSFRAPHFCQMLLAEAGREQKAGGELHTTLDWALQSRIETLVTGHIHNLANQNITNASVLVLENTTGNVKAWIGAEDFFDAAHQGQVDGVLALRQPGSALKPFTYGLALESGFTAASILPDIEMHAATSGGYLSVHNYDETYHGPVRLRTALACSYNVPAVRVLEVLGADWLLSRLQKLGMSNLNKPATYYGLGLTLGNGEVSLAQLTNAYRALANGGNYSPIKTRLDEAGLSVLPFQGESVFSPQIAFLLADILSDPQARAPAFGLGGPLRLPFPCAAKTGTSKDYRDNWTVGYTSQYTVGVWVGNFDGQPMHKSSGISGAAPLFRDIMLTLHAPSDPAPFIIPPNLIKVAVCQKSGKLPGVHCSQQLEEWFIKGTAPTSVCDVHRAYLIDLRNEQLATRQTPQEQVEERVFEIWPEEYASWMAANRLPLPPASYSEPVKEPRQRLAISFPSDGDIFKIDPILRPEYQTLQLEALVPQGIETIEWIVDSVSFAKTKSPYSARWQLTEGSHRMQLKADSQPTPLYSPEILISVY